MRFGEHLRQANAESQSLFHKALRDLVPDAKSIHHTIIAAGINEDQANDAEEYLVDKYSFHPKHPNGLNMIPGGREGIRYLHKLGATSGDKTYLHFDREAALESFLVSQARKGKLNPLVSQMWLDDKYAEAVICGGANRLSGEQVRKIRWLSICGLGAQEICEEVDASSAEQVRNVLNCKTYIRIRGTSTDDK